MRKGSPPTTSGEPTSAVTSHHQRELSQVANKPIIQPKGTHGMETMLHIYYSLACMAMTCLAIPALPVAIWAHQYNRKKNPNARISIDRPIRIIGRRGL